MQAGTGRPTRHTITVDYYPSDRTFTLTVDRWERSPDDERWQLEDRRVTPILTPDEYGIRFDVALGVLDQAVQAETGLSRTPF
jgi:hypothetical protein